MWWLLLLPLIANAQTSSEVEDIQQYEKQFKKVPPTPREPSKPNKYENPRPHISMEQIIGSGIDTGAIGPGKTLYDLDGKVHLVTTEHFYTRFYKMQDEHGFHYILNEDGSVKYKIVGDNIETIKLESDLYVPPHKYTPAPQNIIRAEYDSKLLFHPELAFYTGIVNGSYMKDLFDDSNAQSGISTQYGLHVIANWDLPVRAGLALHYEKTNYKLSNGNAYYSSYNFGPLFKSREFEVANMYWRAQMQFRVSPISSVVADTGQGAQTIKFNSADLMLGVEHPFRNRYGEFVLGFFFQSQWLSLKNQQEVVAVRASNETNKSYGISLSQVFE